MEDFVFPYPEDEHKDVLNLEFSVMVRACRDLVVNNRSMIPELRES